MPTTSASSGDSDGEVEREQPQKKLKITASNGYLARYKFEFHATKSASIPLKRVHSKAKLGLLPSLPLDILFEVLFLFNDYLSGANLCFLDADADFRTLTASRCIAFGQDHQGFSTGVNA